MDSRLEILNIIYDLHNLIQNNYVESNKNSPMKVKYDEYSYNPIVYSKVIQRISELREKYNPTDRTGKIDALNKHFLEDRIQELEKEVVELKIVIKELSEKILQKDLH